MPEDDTRRGRGPGDSGSDILGRSTGATKQPNRAFGDRGQRWFPDVGFPADRDDLLSSAISHSAPGKILDAIRDLPDRTFTRPDEIPDLYAQAGIHAPDNPRDASR